MRFSSLAIALAASTAAIVALSSPANARGCGGYVNILQWGCAPWDNNPPKAGVTPGYPAGSPKPVAPPVAAAPSAIISEKGGSVISNDGGTLINSHSSKLITQDGAGVISNDGGTLINSHSSKLITQDGAGVISNDGGSMISHDGGSLAPPAGFVMKGAGVTGYTASGPTSEQLAAQKAMNDLQAASGDVTKASAAVLSATDKVDQYATQLAAATKAGDHQVVALVTGELATARKQLDDAGNSLKSVSDSAKIVAAVTLTNLADQKDIDAATKLIGQTVAVVQQNSDSAKAKVVATNNAIAAAAAPAQPSALQIATATAAATDAAKAVQAAKDANDGVQALTAKYGNRPTNTDDLLKVNRAMASSAVDAATAKLAKAQSDLVAMSANGASQYDVQGQKDLITKSQSEVIIQKGMVANDYAGKRIAADSAGTDLTNAKAVVDGLTKAYGGNRPTDPQQNANITAAMVVQALAQDKADQTAADVQAAKLIAMGGSKNDIQVQQDLSAAKQKDMAGILKVNPQVLAAAGVAGSTDPAIVAKAITGVVATAAKQTSTAVQQTSMAVQQADAALQRAKTTPTPAPAVSVVVTSATDTAASLISSLKKTSETLSSMSVKPPAVAATAPNLPGPTLASTSVNTVATSSSQNPTGGGAPVTSAATPPVPVMSAAEIANSVSLQKNLAAAQAQVNGRSQQIANFNQSLTDLQTQRAATADPTRQSGIDAAINSAKFELQVLQQTLDRENKQVGDLQSAAAKAAPAPAPAVDKSSLTPAMVQQLLQAGPAVVQGLQAQQQAAAAKGDKTTADALSKDIGSLQQQIAVAKAIPAATTPAAASTNAAPVGNTGAVASTLAKTAPETKPATPVVVATAPATPAASAPGATSPAVSTPVEAQALTKITPDQGKALQQALRTIPSDLTKAEGKSFGALSAMVDRATTKGLTPEEAAFVTEGLKVLAEKHPKAEKQIGLTTIANTVAMTPKPTVALTTPAVAPEITAKPADSKNGNAAALAVPKPTVALTTPDVAPEITAKPADSKNGNAAAPAVPKPTVALTTLAVAPATTTTSKPTSPAPPATPKLAVASRHPAAASARPTAPQPGGRLMRAQVTAPRAPQPALAAAKPPAAPKPQSCTPNMQNGRQVGMTCH